MELQKSSFSTFPRNNAPVKVNPAPPTRPMTGDSDNNYFWHSDITNGRNIDLFADSDSES